MPFLETGGFSGTLVIFEHPAALYRYSPALEMHRMRDTRLDDFETCLDLQTFIPVFNETFERALQSGRPIITMPYTPLTAKVLQTCLRKYYGGLLDHWLCVSFFHDDEDTAKITLANGESPLAYKTEILKELLVFPFIKKIEIPYGFLLTYPSLHNLIESAIGK
jgi:hypothetical protein